MSKDRSDLMQPPQKSVSAYEYLVPQDENLFFSRNDPEDPRLGEFTAVELGSVVSSLWAYPDAAGIQANGGRTGAEQAPSAVRSCLYRMTPGRSWPRSCLLQDLGNWNFEALSLDEKAEITKSAVFDHYRSQSSFLFTLGGGHDYGYPDAAGFVEAFRSKDPKLKPLVINFDAHLDVRPLDRGLTSGTPFRKLLETYRDEFDFVEVGIQNHCNSPFHWDWALQNGAIVLPIENIRQHGLQESLAANIEADASRPVFLSLDIDCFNSGEAPGCSAPNAAGLSIAEFQKLWPWLFQSFDIKGLGIYEVSPPHDVDSRTSRLAALMIYNSLHEILKRRPK